MLRLHCNAFYSRVENSATVYPHLERDMSDPLDQTLIKTIFEGINANLKDGKIVPHRRDFFLED